MITRRTKIQLVIFAIITALGVSYVGARYARLDRLFYDDTYTVVVHLQQSGGIFTDAEVTYRGVGVGKVAELRLTSSGVDAYLDVEKTYDAIPADTLAVVGNRSAVGEQYVELQPQTDDKPFLEESAEIATADTETPLPTQVLLTDLSRTLESIDKPSLRTTVLELGTAFAGTGPDLGRIIDTGSSFLTTADANFTTTQALLRDSNVVLATQVDKESAIRTFSRNLKLVGDTLVASDGDLRTIIDTGSGTALELRRLIEDNRVDLGQLISRLTTTGEVVTQHLDGIAQLLVLYPYVVEGGLTVVAKTPETGLMDAHFGLILTTQQPCHDGYQSTNTRPPQNGANRKMNFQARCTEPPTQSNARGAQNISRAPADYRSPVVATWDEQKQALTWGDEQVRTLSAPGSVAPRSLGKDTWKWLYLQPLTAPRE